MSDWMPGAVQRPQPGGVTLDTSLPPRFVWHITWDQLRADGTQPNFGAVADYLVRMQYCPHIMWNPFTGYMEQYYPASVGGRALKYNNQDGAACIQVEVFFTPGCVVDGVRYDTVADTPLVGFADLLAWGESLGVPLVWPMGAPQWTGNNRDTAIWNANAGHYGHCHSPGDTHTDPGPMPALTGSTIRVQSATITPEDDMAADTPFVSKDGAHVTLQDLLNSIDRKVEAALTAAKTAASEATNAKNNASDAAGRVSYAYANLPAAMLNQRFTLPDGTATNLAGILAAIHAQPTGTAGAVADPAAIAHAIAATLSLQFTTK